jgi:O-antigen ligase
MVGLKPPTWHEGRLAFLALAWAITSILAITRLLEMTGLLPVKFQPPGIIQFDTEYYWLPINHALGIEGRWPGPFGHNGYTAMMGAFIIVIAVAFWSRSSWVFIPIGVFTLVITSGRASVGAAVVGLILIAMMTTTGRLGRVPRKWRVPLGLVVLLLGGLVLFGGKSGLTGRQVIWPAFLDLWKTSPWTGVGGGGIAVSGGITQQFGHAHSMYLDLLVRDGVFAFATVMVALAIALGITLVAGFRGRPAPLAILAAFLITGITEPRNDWLHPGTDVLMVVLCVMTAAVALRQDHADRLSTVLREEKVT